MAESPLSRYFRINEDGIYYTKSFAHFLEVFGQNTQRTYVHRGLSNSLWGLETSFERSYFGWYDRERMLIDLFRSRMNQFVRSEMIPSDTLETLAFMQHYGVPTRLLDFTYSFYIAAYFACRDQHDIDGCIYTLHLPNITRLSVNVMREDKIDIPPRLLMNKEFLNIGNYIFTDSNYKSIISLNKYASIFPAAPFKQNERLSRQQGLFLFSCKLGQPFEQSLFDLLEDSLKKTKYSEGSSDLTISKTIIPAKLKKHFLQELHRMNITAETLFEGIEGFARSLKEQVSAIE